MNREQDVSEHLKANDQLLTVQEEIALAKAWREHGCAASRERLITSHMRLVRMIARQYSGRGTAFDELVADGHVGLVRAADRYDPSSGARFSTYATYWIRNSIVESFVKNAGGPKLSPAMRADLVQFEHQNEVFRAQQGRAPTQGELAETLGWTMERVSEMQQIHASRTKPVLMGTLTSDERSLNIAGHAEEPEVLGDEARLAKLSSLLSRLPTEERRTIELRFGLDGGPVRHVSNIAELLGTAQRVVRARLESGMSKLTRWANADAMAAAHG